MSQGDVKVGSTDLDGDSRDLDAGSGAIDGEMMGWYFERRERAGYRPIGKLGGCLRVGDQDFNLTMYEKRL